MANIKNVLSIVNFSWLTTFKSMNFESLKIEHNQCVNGFEFHKELTTKNRVIVNLTNAFKGNLSKVFDLTPVTFIIDLNS